MKHLAQREGSLLSFLRQELGLSSTLLKRLKYRNGFFVNGESVHTNYPVKHGDEILVVLDEDAPDYPAQEGALTVLFEDEALIAIDKPAGMLMHPSPAKNTDTLANYLLFYYQKTNQPCAVHPVSRLDRDTFGVVLLAKNAHVHAKMHAQLLKHSLEKTYHAAVCGIPPETEGLIDAPIARRSPESLLRCVREDGKAAQTRYRVLEERNGCALLELQPLTGRTHQLRVHCAHMGFPIAGDPQYGHDAYGLPYQQLCAVKLRFCHPMTGNFVEIFTKQSVSLDFLGQDTV